jgi:hypothetical protein
MNDDILRDETKEIHNPEDIIDVHDERRAHFAGDVDAFEPDVEIDEELDVDEALTFPHPKHKKPDEVGPLVDKEDTDEVWAYRDRDMQPEDYEEGYDGVMNTYATDDMDAVDEELIHEMSHLNAEDVPVESEVEVMPNKFTPDEETEE